MFAETIKKEYKLKTPEGYHDIRVSNLFEGVRFKDQKSEIGYKRPGKMFSKTINMNKMDSIP